MTISIKHYNTTVTVECPDDVDAIQLADHIKGILLIQGWCIETINEAFATDDEWVGKE